MSRMQTNGARLAPGDVLTVDQYSVGRGQIRDIITDVINFESEIDSSMILNLSPSFLPSFPFLSFSEPQK